MKDDNASNVKMMVSGVMLATLFGKILGFLKELVLAYFFGAGNISDAYLISQTIPGTLFLVVGTGISTCYVPIYLKIRTNEGVDEARKFTNKFITLIVVISLLFSIVLEIIPGFFVKIFAVGFDNDTFAYAVRFTRINACSLVLSGFLYCFSALLQSEKKYHHVAISNIPYNLGLIIAIVLGSCINIYLLSIVSVVAVALQLGYQLIYVNKIPYYYKLSVRFNDRNLMSSLALLPPVILGVAATEINTLIDRTLASSIIVGGITVITYGTSLFNLIIGVFSQSIAAVYYPEISEAGSTKNKTKLVKSVQEAVFVSLYFLLPCTVGAVILREPIVRVLFDHGEFGTSNTKILSSVFACYGIGFIPFSLKQILNNVYYAHERTKKPMINTIISVVVNVFLNFVLSRLIGLMGLAIATSISAILVALLLICDCKKDYEINIFSNPRRLTVLLLCTLFMGGVCWFLNSLLGYSMIKLVGVVLLSAIIYCASTFVLHVCPYRKKTIRRSE